MKTINKFKQTAMAIKLELDLVRSNPILKADTYKFAHWQFLPENTTKCISYVESRGGKYKKVMWSQFQQFLIDNMLNPVLPEHVEYARYHCALTGCSFNYEGWMRIATKWKGIIPVKIRAVEEGCVVPVGNMLVEVESVDDEIPWITTFVETQILRGSWYGTTVGTIAWYARMTMMACLEISSDNPDHINFALHDFGARGVSSSESAELGGSSLFAAGFMGSDTTEGIYAANIVYQEEMAGFGVDATEHSVTTVWTREQEFEFFIMVITTAIAAGKNIISIVADSYNYKAAVAFFCSPEVMKLVKDSNIKLVIRPDSGKMEELLPWTLNYLYDNGWAGIVNSKGYKTLDPQIGLLWGDGINDDTLPKVLLTIMHAEFSTDTTVLGMGGGLLQHCDRDTQQFAMKGNAAIVNGEWVDVFKDPITDPGKRSKKGRQELLTNDLGEYVTVGLEHVHEKLSDGWYSAMVTVFDAREGGICYLTNLKDVRERSNTAARRDIEKTILSIKSVMKFCGELLDTGPY
jgi:nicotinamide phosphoribosyltransferase